MGTTARAPLLRPADFGVWLAGDSGRYKSEMTALVQQHFGPAMDRVHLPTGKQTPKMRWAQSYFSRATPFW
jgi:hypothetical protein